MDKPASVHILLVDDRPERLLALETILEPLNQTLVSVTSGEDALRQLLQYEFAVILLDVRMPGLDGFETAQLIRQRASSAHTPIIFVTGSREWEDMERAYTLGAVDFISVPLNPFVLRAKVSVFVDLFQATQQVKAETAARIREEEIRKRAERENHTKDEFIATISHELRTPLTPVIAAIEMLEQEPDLKALHQTLHLMRRNLELEARLIDDLLDLTRVRTGDLHMQAEVVNVHNALQRAVEICESRAREKSVRLTCDAAAEQRHVRADAARLQQVFWNLLGNAVKFTPENGTVTASTSNPTPAEIRISVADTGVGIDPHHLHRIFHRFEQVSRGAIKQGGLGGLGLGLWMSKSLIGAMGGKIWAASRGIGRGATLHVSLPTIAAPVGDAEQPAADSAKEGCKGLRVLLVDDHPDTLEVLHRILLRKGCSVETAGSIDSALKAAQEKRFDLLISDIGLPDGSGVDLVRRLRQMQPVVAIALSGFGMDQDVQASKEAGFAEHLTKPVNIERLEAVILKHCCPAQPGSER